MNNFSLSQLMAAHICIFSSDSNTSSLTDISPVGKTKKANQNFEGGIKNERRLTVPQKWQQA